MFLEPPHSVGGVKKAAHQKWSWFLFFRGVDIALRATEPFFPKSTRKRAIEASVAFVKERLNGEDGLGAIYPAMANSVMMYDVLGYPEDHPDRAIARLSIDKLLVIKDDEAYCQPCVSPVWDTALTAHTMLEAGGDRAKASAQAGLDWLIPRQVLDVKGDWAEARPNVRPGGWAFQYNNAHYPDLDDTAVVAMAMDRAQANTTTHDFDNSLSRAREWILGLQSKNGGWGAFDADNELHLPEQHPVLGSRRAARSTDRRRYRALHLDAGADAGRRRRRRGDRGRHRISAQDAIAGWLMVWPLGPELHLRHLVVALRTQRGWPRPQVRHGRERHPTGC